MKTLRQAIMLFSRDLRLHGWIADPWSRPWTGSPKQQKAGNDWPDLNAIRGRGRYHHLAKTGHAASDEQEPWAWAHGKCGPGEQEPWA
jgi:hypothetical protein